MTIGNYGLTKKEPKKTNKKHRNKLKERKKESKDGKEEKQPEDRERSTVTKDGDRQKMILDWKQYKKDETQLNQNKLEQQ